MSTVKQHTTLRPVLVIRVIRKWCVQSIHSSK